MTPLDASTTGTARNLSLSWLVLGTGGLGIASVFALLLVIARVPPLSGWLPDLDFFYPSLVLHVNLSMLVWFLAMAGSLWSLQAGERARRLAWLGFALAALGTALMVLSPIAGGRVYMSDYVPVLDNPGFLSGLGLFAGGVLVTAGRRLGAGLWAPAADGPPRLGLFLVALTVVLAGLVMGVSLLRFGSGLSGQPFFQNLFWAGGHTLQFAFALLALTAWLALLGRDGATPVGSRGTRRLVLLAFLPVLAALPVAVVLDEGAQRDAYTVLMASGGWLAVLPLAIVLGAKVVRRAGLPSRYPPEILLSMALFVVGGVAGALIRGPSILVPAHYHGAIGAVTLALMALVPRLLSAFGTASVRDGRRGPLLYGVGTLLLVVAMAVAGSNGVPRKTPGLLAGLEPGDVAALVAMGLGAAIALWGSFLFVTWTLGAVRPAVLPAFRRDRRLVAALMALILVIAPGMLIHRMAADDAAFPSHSPRLVLSDEWRSVLAPTPPPTVDPASEPAGHAAERRRLEIDRRFKQAVVMLHSGQLEYAVAALERVLELRPDLPEAHVNLGFAWLGLEEAAAARDSFEKAIDLRPRQANAYYGLALALERMGDLETASGVMRAFLHLAAPDDPFVTKAMGALWDWDSKRGRLSAPIPPVSEGTAMPPANDEG